MSASAPHSWGPVIGSMTTCWPLSWCLPGSWRGRLCPGEGSQAPARAQIASKFLVRRQVWGWVEKLNQWVRGQITAVHGQAWARLQCSPGKESEASSIFLARIFTAAWTKMRELHCIGEGGEGDADSREEWKSASRTAGQAEISPNDLEQRSGGQGCFL